MNYEIIAIILTSITGPGIAILTVYLEYRKDKKEKLQDRKDMWLDVHYKELYEELQKFADEIIKQDKTDSTGKLETSVIEYQYDNTSITATMNNTISKGIIKNNKNSLQHLMHNYKNIYNSIGSLFIAEGKYKYQLNKIINEVFEDIKTLMSEQFHELEPGENSLSTKEGKLIYYDIKTIYLNLIKKIIKSSVIIGAHGINETKPSYLYFNYPSNDIIMVIPLQDKPKTIDIVNKFMNSVWNPLNNKYSEKINKLYKTHNNLIKNEEDIKNSLQQIINGFKLGHVIEGYCDVCDKIYHETDITKLRPKL